MEKTQVGRGEGPTQRTHAANISSERLHQNAPTDVNEATVWGEGKGEKKSRKRRRFWSRRRLIE